MNSCLVGHHDQDDIVAKVDTGRDGRFTFADVAPGRWWIGVEPDRAQRQQDEAEAAQLVPLAVAVEFGAGEVPREVVLRTYRGLFIRGRVLRPDDAPAGDGLVFGLSELGSLTSQCAPDGSFAVGPLVPGPCALKASAFGRYADSEQVIARDGDVDVILRLRAASSLSVLVRDGKTKAPCAAKLYLSAPDGSVYLPESGQDGKAKMEPLAPGTYHLACGTVDGRFAWRRGIEVKSGQSIDDVVLELETGARVTVRYHGADDYAQCRFLADGIIVAVEAIGNATQATVTVPAGRVTVECHADGRHEKELDLVAGDLRVVEMDLRRK